MQMTLKDKDGNELIVMANGLSAMRERNAHAAHVYESESGADILLAGQSEWTELDMTWEQLKAAYGKMIPGSTPQVNRRVFFEGTMADKFGDRYGQPISGLGMLHSLTSERGAGVEILNDYGVIMVVAATRIIDVDE